MGTGTILQEDGVCSSVNVELRDIWNFNKGRVYYGHSRTYLPGWVFTIKAGSGWIYTNYEVGFSWETEHQQCRDRRWWTSQHLHQNADASRFTPNYALYDHIGWYDPITLKDRWQYVQSWNWQ